MKKNKKKLELDKETVRPLQPEEGAEVAGGTLGTAAAYTGGQDLQVAAYEPAQVAPRPNKCTEAITGCPVR